MANPKPVVWVPDTSVVIDGRLTTMVETGQMEGHRIVVPEAVVAELEAQANQGRESGLAGLDELAKLHDLARAGRVTVELAGARPSIAEIERASTGAIDAMVRQVARDVGGRLYTSDRVLAAVAAATAVDHQYVRPQIEASAGPDDSAISAYFVDDAMSVHLKVGALPHAKRGRPGQVAYEPIPGCKESTHQDLTRLSNEVIEASRRDARSFVEIERAGCTVVQLGPMRITIARPPFSDALEVTAVRPVRRLDLADYELDDSIVGRLTDHNRGVLISGPPGSGKSTLAQAVADHLHAMAMVVKTMESPRDLQVHQDVTQYAPLDDDMALTGEILLLVRPDYVIFDEVRRTEHFEVYADMRLAGVGLIGVTHANRAIDAVQRLIGRVELGMIPQVVDTVVHIQNGQVGQVLEMEFSVRVPSGMTEADLARPVIVVKDFRTRKEVYEIYTYGEQVVVMPISGKAKRSGAAILAQDQLQQLARGWVNGEVEVEMGEGNKAVIHVDEEEIPRLIGRGGENIRRLEKELGLSLDIKPLAAGSLSGRDALKGVEVAPQVVRTKKDLLLYVQPEFAGTPCAVLIDGKEVFFGTVSHKGEVRLKKGSEPGRAVMSAHAKGRRLRVRV